MSVHVAVALIAVVLQAASAAVMFFVARAPGWQRVRLMGGIAVTAGLYSVVDVWFSLSVHDIALRSTLVQVNVVVAALHAAMWVWFTFSDSTGALRSVPRWARAVAIVPTALAVPAALADLLVDRSREFQLFVTQLGIDERVHPFSNLGDATALVVLAVLGVSMARHIRRVRRGEKGARGIVIGFVLFAVCIVAEALVASGILKFMYLASPGYVFIVLPLTVQLLQRIGDDARQLQALSARLTVEVTERTSERDEARESLIEQQRLAALGRLAAGVGHEINNPLQYLMFNLEELRGRPPRDGEELRAIDQALEGADRIRRVVESLRRYGTPSDEFTLVDLHAVLHTALRIASPQLRHEAMITTSLEPVPLVRGDEGQLVQMLVNPLVNAVQTLAHHTAQAPKRAGHVLLTTRTTENGSAEILIQDNGPGFAPEVLPKLGEPYVTTRAKRGGTGLGLFVTHGLVTAHGGTLTLENAPDGGAIVRIVLPPAPAHSLNEAPHDGGRALRPDFVSRHILVVDDEPSLVLALERGLTRLGHRVRTAYDGEQALALIDVHEFDVVLSDLMMPSITGQVLAEVLRERNPALRERLVIMTGGAVTPEDAAFLAREDVAVVSKPVRFAQLSETINALPLPVASPADRHKR